MNKWFFRLSVPKHVRDLNLEQVLGAIDALGGALAKQGREFYAACVGRVPPGGCESCKKKRLAAQMRGWLVTFGGKQWRSGISTTENGAKHN